MRNNFRQQHLLRTRPVPHVDHTYKNVAQRMTMGHRRKCRPRAAWALIAALSMAIGLNATASAAPTSSPYPDTAHYRPDEDLVKYQAIDQDGLWFTTPLGLYCGISEDGSYGCSGKLPGVPADTNEIAWFTGDPFPRLYHTDQPRFNSDAGQTILNGQTYIDYRGVRCAITFESALYCIHGSDPDSQFMVSSGATYRGPQALRG
ncbi:MAG: hypothetical protein P4L48_09940 [Mycobacterium sp.]|nr:hypothetical protein [Mycobacterium sp.]